MTAVADACDDDSGDGHVSTIVMVTEVTTRAATTVRNQMGHMLTTMVTSMNVLWR